MEDFLGPDGVGEKNWTCAKPTTSIAKPWQINTAVRFPVFDLTDIIRNLFYLVPIQKYIILRNTDLRAAMDNSYNMVQFLN